MLPTNSFSKVGFRQCFPGELTQFELIAGGIEHSRPRCPNCRSLLLQTLVIPSEYIREIVGIDLADDVSLLFCWHCPASMQLCYGYGQDGNIEFRRWAAGSDKDLPPYSDYPESFPEFKVGFCKQSDQEREIHHMLIARNQTYSDIRRRATEIGVDRTGMQPIYQIGGLPFLFEPPPSSLCCVCNSVLRFLATIPNWNTSSEGFAGSESVLMLYQICEECKTVCASNQTD